MEKEDLNEDVYSVLNLLEELNIDAVEITECVGNIFECGMSNESSGDDTDDEDDNVVGGLVESKRNQGNAENDGLCVWCWSQFGCTTCSDKDEDQYRENESLTEEVVISDDVRGTNNPVPEVTETKVTF